jgi:hypothetical protein
MYKIRPVETLPLRSLFLPPGLPPRSASHLRSAPPYRPPPPPLLSHAARLISAPPPSSSSLHRGAEALDPAEQEEAVKPSPTPPPPGRVRYRTPSSPDSLLARATQRCPTAARTTARSPTASTATAAPLSCRPVALRSGVLPGLDALRSGGIEDEVTTEDPPVRASPVRDARFLTINHCAS